MSLLGRLPTFFFFFVIFSFVVMSLFLFLLFYSEGEWTLEAKILGLEVETLGPWISHVTPESTSLSIKWEQELF